MLFFWGGSRRRAAVSLKKKKKKKLDPRPSAPSFLLSASTNTAAHYSTAYSVFRGVLTCYVDPATGLFAGLQLPGGATCSSQAVTVDATRGAVTQVVMSPGAAPDEVQGGGEGRGRGRGGVVRPSHSLPYLLQIQAAVFTITPDNGTAPYTVACGSPAAAPATTTLLQPGDALAGVVAGCQSTLDLVTTSVNATGTGGGTTALDASNATAPLVAVAGNATALNETLPFIPGASWLPPPRSLFAGGSQAPVVVVGATGNTGPTGWQGPGERRSLLLSREEGGGGTRENAHPAAKCDSARLYPPRRLVHLWRAVCRRPWARRLAGAA